MGRTRENTFFAQHAKKNLGSSPKPSAGARRRPSSGLYVLVKMKVNFKRTPGGERPCQSGGLATATMESVVPLKPQRFSAFRPLVRNLSYADIAM